LGVVKRPVVKVIPPLAGAKELYEPGWSTEQIVYVPDERDQTYRHYLVFPRNLIAGLTVCVRAT